MCDIIDNKCKHDFPLINLEEYHEYWTKNRTNKIVYEATIDTCTKCLTKCSHKLYTIIGTPTRSVLLCVHCGTDKLCY